MHLIRWLVSVYTLPFVFYLFAACETEQEIPLGLQDSQTHKLGGVPRPNPKTQNTLNCR